MAESIVQGNISADIIIGSSTKQVYAESLFYATTVGNTMSNTLKTWNFDASKIIMIWHSLCGAIGYSVPTDWETKIAKTWREHAQIDFMSPGNTINLAYQGRQLTLKFNARSITTSGTNSTGGTATWWVISGTVIAIGNK